MDGLFIGKKKIKIFVFFFFIFFFMVQGNSEKDTLFTSFDWEYYKEQNNLPGIYNEQNALDHYQKIGFFEKLEYCKKFTIIILLYIHDIHFMDEFIDKINNFIRLNDKNTYIVKINIPLDGRVETFKAKQQDQKTDKNIFYAIANSTPYHREKITNENANLLYSIAQYLKDNIETERKNIQVLFSESRGAQTGGFFLLLDQVIKQRISHDFIMKLHTNIPKDERKILTSFLHIKLSKALRKFKALYAKQHIFDVEKESATSKYALNDIVNFFELKAMKPKKKFGYCPREIFIVNRAFTEFFKKYDLAGLFHKLPKVMSCEMQQAYERLLGFLIDYLHLNTLVTGFHPFKYCQDNTVAINSSILVNYDLGYAKELIKKNDIQVMAIYFPQFHECEENNKLWGKGFTEWTLMNRYKGEIKKPHIDVGQYNMLDFSTRKKQALMAKEHGIDAFCYYHYWFSGRKVMHAGLERILKDNEPNIPFIFCWANEPWTRNWDGSNREILLDQKYGIKESWKKHFDYLLPFFKHHNYIKENNCPLFFIYRLEHIVQNNALEMFKLWKEMAIEAGFDGLKIISMLGGHKPSQELLPGYIDGFAEHMPTYLSQELIFSKEECNDAQETQKKIAGLARSNSIYYSGTFYSFDNSSRRINLPVIKFSKLSYKSLENLFINTIFRIAKYPNTGTNYILLNSWNEWTEQAMFEPNDVDGYRLLEITKKIFR